MNPTETTILEEILKRIRSVTSPDKVILFGSRARGGALPDSDWDLLVIKSGVEHRRRLAQEIYMSLIGVRASVDVLVISPDDLIDTQPWTAVAHAVRDGKVVYEARS